MRGRARLRRTSAAILAILACGLAAPGLAETPQERLARILAEAEQREVRAASFVAEAEGELAALEAIDRQVVEFRRSAQRLQAMGQRAQLEIAAVQSEIATRRTDLEAIRQAVRRRLVSLYKLRASRRGPALYSARDLQSGLRVAVAIEQALQADFQLFREYEAKLAELERREQLARSLIEERTALDGAYRARQEKERKKLIQRRNLVDLLRTRAERERRAAGELREAAARLEEQIRTGTADVAGVTLVRGRVPWPVRGEVRVRFGRQVEPEFNTVIRRNGIEIDAPLETPVRAVAPGRVLYAGWLRGYGQMVIVNHGAGNVTVSGFLGELAVSAQDVVKAGDVLGRVGETGSLRGAGLYFELRQNGEPVDPQAWLE